MLAINGICKNWARVIMCYGLSEDQLNVINDNLPTSGCEVMSVDCFTDIIAMPQMVAIVVWDIMSEIDRGSFEEFFTDIAPFLETVIVIGKPDVNKELSKQILVYDTFDALAENLKYKLLGAYKKTKKSENFSATLANALIILKAIKTKPYVTTQQLAEGLEMSQRSVQRYIETLRVSGEWIEYDTTHKGWVAGPGWEPDDDLAMNKTIEKIKNL